jgi:hypothetical protein
LNWLLRDTSSLDANTEEKDMNNFGPAVGGFFAGVIVCFIALTASQSQLVKEARAAEADGRTINNDTMQTFYPQDFRAGYPAYLERDFEAGADLICNAIQNEFNQDLCSTNGGIGWR